MPLAKKYLVATWPSDSGNKVYETTTNPKFQYCMQRRWNTIFKSMDFSNAPSVNWKNELRKEWGDKWEREILPAIEAWERNKPSWKKVTSTVTTLEEAIASGEVKPATLKKNE